MNPSKGIVFLLLLSTFLAAEPELTQLDYNCFCLTWNSKQGKRSYFCGRLEACVLDYIIHDCAAGIDALNQQRFINPSYKVGPSSHSVCTMAVLGNRIQVVRFCFETGFFDLNHHYLESLLSKAKKYKKNEAVINEIKKARDALKWVDDVLDIPAN